MTPRDAIMREARSWIGTPYHHQASARGAGCDCLGLVRGVWRGLYGAEPEIPPPYTPDWAETGAGDTLAQAAARHLTGKDKALAEPGDVLLFAWRAGLPAKHCAIMSGPAAMIHAYNLHAVAEVALAPWWRRRLVHVFAFPGL